jgi:hypothetical protein
MSWWSKKSIIMTLLFLGVLLLITGYFYFGYNKEGFQSSSGSSSLPNVATCQAFNTDGNPDYRIYNYTVSETPSRRSTVKNYAVDPNGVPVYTRVSNTNKEINSVTDIATEAENKIMCSANCGSAYNFPSMTDEEKTAYGAYEEHNLLDTKLTAPPVVVPTFVKQYNSAGALTPLDHSMSNPIPWDFDNKDLDPAISLFGAVSPIASQLIFAKCECQTLYGSINNLDYDPNSGLFSYQSAMFGTIMYDQREASAYQIGEMFVQEEIGNLMSQMFSYPFEMANEKIERSINFHKEAKFKLDAQIADYKTMLSINGGDEIGAARRVQQNTETGVYDEKWHKYGEGKTPTQIPLSKIDEINGVDKLKRGWLKWGRSSIRKSPLNIDFEASDGGLSRIKALIEASENERLKSDKNFIKGKGVAITDSLLGMKNMQTSLVNNDRTSKNTPKGKTTIIKRIGDLIWSGRAVQQSAALKANTNIALKLAERQITSNSVMIGYNTVVAIINALAVGGLATGPAGATVVAGAIYLNTIIITIKFLMLAIQLACLTFVGPLFSSFLDFDAVCPLNTNGSTMFNIDDYFQNKSLGGSKFPGGELGGFLLLSILQNLPEVGPLMMALGPYICFPDNDTIKAEGGKVNLKIKNNLRSPPYYFDPTLSLYNAGSKPRFMAGLSTLDQRLYNPLLFHYGREISKPKTINNPDGSPGPDGYPVWVDFANPIMLNKMAQFYYDYSRKCLTTTSDGMVSFQYISKFYGLITTTELTCDVQCEITEIKFNPDTGMKICEVIIPVDDETLVTQYHDRRFYFYKDMGKSTINRLPERTTEKELDELMKDNLAIYIVTGCTTVDGSAPDCITYDDQGNSVENPVISLGEPGKAYMSPMVDVSSIATKGATVDGEVTWYLPQESTCGQKTFTRYNGVNNSRATNNDSTRKIEAPVVGNSIELTWKYAYKAENGTYYYPDSTYANQLKSSGNNIVPVTDNLQTTKHWTMVWNNVCRYQDAKCQINSKQGIGTIVQGTAEGLIGAGFGIGQVQQGYQIAARGRPNPTSANFNAASETIQVTGGAVQTMMSIKFPGQEMSLSQRASCMYDELTNQYGTFIINGRVMTSQQGFIIDQGPFVKWAPGYTPKIQYCNNQTIELFDCVNSSAVHRFVHIYHTNTPDKIIKKIHNITPTLNTGSAWDINTSRGMCIYNVDVMNYDNPNEKEIPDTLANINVGIYLKQNVTNKTCTFVPKCTVGADCLTTDVNKLYKSQVFVKNLDEPTWLPSDPIISSSIHYTNWTEQDKLKFKTRDVKKSFNDAHDDVPTLVGIKDSTGALKTAGGQVIFIITGRFNNVPDSKTSSGGQPKTVLPNGNTLTLENQPVNLNNTLQNVIRKITITFDSDGNYISDDFPIFYTYTPIPKRSKWFDVPPRISPLKSPLDFAKPGCENDPVFNNCSNVGLIDILVKDYNEQDTTSRIVKVLRAYTPSINNAIVCDYDVERIKKFTDTMNTQNKDSAILNRETIRFFLMENLTGGQCNYKLDYNATYANSTNINGGSSLNSSSTLGLLVSPYTLAVSYSKKVQTDYFSALKNYIGYDIPGIITNTTTNILNNMKTTRKSIYSNISLRGCPSKTCMDDTIIKAMVNRYNFDTYPSYPAKQNSQIKDSIIRVTKVGMASSVECQLELYLRTDFFTDILYSPLPQDTKFYMRNYKFNLQTTNDPSKCKFKVKPFTIEDISKNTMDIQNDAYSLECPPAPEPCPSAITQSSSASYSWVTTDYNSPMISCNINEENDPILMLITNMYNNIVIYTKNGVTYHNTINKITKSFSATPNILEFKITTQRVYWDNNYNTAYYTGKPTDPIEDSFLVVKWPEGTSYEVETGYYWKDYDGNFVNTPSTGISIVGGIATSGNYKMCTPIIEEFFFPDLIFTSNGMYKEKPDGSQVEVILPYLANDGLTGVDPQQNKRFECNPNNCINSDGAV